jgi:hypothetical protein
MVTLSFGTKKAVGVRPRLATKKARASTPTLLDITKKGQAHYDIEISTSYVTGLSIRLS